MQFDEIIKEIKTTSFETLRIESNDYFEAVILNRELGNFTAGLKKIFGFPVEPAKKKPVIPD